MTWFYLSVALLSIFSLNGKYMKYECNLEQFSFIIFIFFKINFIKDGIEAKKRKLVDHPTIASRIVGGNDAVDGQGLFQASLQINGSHYCGCVIIESEFLLTAGHCIAG